MDKIPFDVLIHSENALIRALELKTVLDELAEKWLVEYENEVDIITFGGYESITKVHIIPYFKEHKIKVNEVTYETIQKYIDEKKKISEN